MTTPLTDPETLRARAAEIARGLSKGAQKFLCSLSSNLQVVNIPFHEKTTWHLPDLIEEATPFKIGTRRLRLTPLGIAVREYLQGNPHDD